MERELRTLTPETLAELVRQKYGDAVVTSPAVSAAESWNAPRAWSTRSSSSSSSPSSVSAALESVEVTVCGDGVVRTRS